MRPIAVFGIRIEKELFGKYNKTLFSNPRIAEMLACSPSVRLINMEAKPEDLINVYGEGFFEPYDQIRLWNSELVDTLVVLDAEQYCYKVKLCEVIIIEQNIHMADYHINSEDIDKDGNIDDGQLVFYDKVVTKHAVVFGYSLPENHKELDLAIHDENGEFIFHVPYGNSRRTIKLPPLAIKIPESDKKLMDKYVNLSSYHLTK